MKRKTQEAKVLEYIKTHGSITTFEAFANLHITRLSGRIFELKKHGNEIVKQMITDADGTRYARYYLKGDQKNV